MKSMSIVDQGRSRLNCVCRCAIGFCERTEAGDPHLGGREGVHPADQADAVRRRVGLAAHLQIDSGVVTTGLNTTRTGSRDEPLSSFDDAAAVLSDLPQGLFAVEVLAARDKPCFQSFQFHGDGPSMFCP